MEVFATLEEGHYSTSHTYRLSPYIHKYEPSAIILRPEIVAERPSLELSQLTEDCYFSSYHIIQQRLKHILNRCRKLRQIQSMSSSEEDLPSTSEFLGGEESVQRVPNECTSEKGLYLLRYIYGSEKIKNGRKS
uniref:Uncharacterized protein n=1 Tax=Heterorhabditis bacteriophora TaxID=37862 RepID=A0A1I7XGL6_HETBA